MCRKVIERNCRRVRRTRKDTQRRNHNERPGKIRTETRSHAAGHDPDGGVCALALRAVWFAWSRRGTAIFPVLLVLLYFLDFDPSGLPGNFDDASSDGRLVGLSHKA